MSDEAAEALRADPALAPLVDQYGPVELEPAADPFRRLVVSLLRQQISMEAADAIRERLFEEFEVTPAAMTAVDSEHLQSVGLSAAKAEYVQATAEAFDQRGYDRAYFEPMRNAEIAEELTEIRGIGPWTVKMFLIYGLARPDVFPVEDLGIRKGIEAVCGTELTRSEMRDRATSWAPYRSYAALYLWRSTD